MEDLTLPVNEPELLRNWNEVLTQLLTLADIFNLKIASCHCNCKKWPVPIIIYITYIDIELHSHK